MIQQNVTLHYETGKSYAVNLKILQNQKLFVLRIYVLRILPTFSKIT